MQLGKQSLHLKPWPYWSQLNDWTWAGESDVNASNNCGPECVSMVLAYLTAVELPADYIKDVMKGENYVGYTSTDDIARYFGRYCHIPSSQSFPTTTNAYLEAVRKGLQRRHPLIGLYYGTAIGANDGHFRCLNGLDTTYVYTADPWTGRRKVETHEESFAWLRNWVIELNRKRFIPESWGY